MLVTQRWIFVSVAALAACGGAGPSPVTSPARSPDQVVSGFLRAVADSDIAGMSALWGTSRGPAATTGQPPDYEKRMVVAQLFLRGAKYRVIRTEAVEGASDRRSIIVELDRTQCVRTVPFTAVQTGNGRWVVTAFDLNLAGTPQRPCEKETSNH